MEERLPDALRRHGLSPAQFAILCELGRSGPKDAANAGAASVWVAKELGLPPVSMEEGARALVESFRRGLLRPVAEEEIDAAAEAWWREENDWASQSTHFRSWVDASEEGARLFSAMLRDARKGEPLAVRRDISPFESVIVTSDRGLAEQWARDGWSAPCPSGPWTLHRFAHFAEGWRIERIRTPEPALDDLRALDAIADHGFTLAQYHLMRAIAEHVCETTASLGEAAIRMAGADPKGRLRRLDYREALADLLRRNRVVRARGSGESMPRPRIDGDSYLVFHREGFDFTREGCSGFAALDAEVCAAYGRRRFGGKVFRDWTAGAERRAFFSVDRDALERAMAGTPEPQRGGGAWIGRTEIEEVPDFRIHTYDALPLVYRAAFLFAPPTPKPGSDLNAVLFEGGPTRREFEILREASHSPWRPKCLAAAAAGPFEEEVAPWRAAVRSLLRRGCLRPATAEDLARDAWARRWQFRLDSPWFDGCLILTAAGAAALAAGRKVLGCAPDFLASQVVLEDGWRAVIAPRAETLGFCFPAGEVRGPWEFGPVWHGPHDRLDSAWRVDVRDPRPAPLA